MPEKNESRPKIFLRPMREEEYEPWKQLACEEYAKDKESEGLSPADARAVAEKSFRDLLANGIKTPDQFLNMIVEAGGSRVLGFLWWGVQVQGTRRIAWVYNIKVEDSERGRGFGRAAMQAAEAEVKAAGFPRLGLHVFGYNQTARNLYRSLGFIETNVIMYKDLD